MPRRLVDLLAPHDVNSVQQAGWSGIKNGAVLAWAAKMFDVFITVDQGIRYQQNLVGLDIAVGVLAARSNDIDDLKPLVPNLLTVLDGTKPGDVIRVAA